MLYLKEANFEDIDKEYEAISKMPKNENGFFNDFYGVSREEFKNNALSKMINRAKGIDLQEDDVAKTYYFLWDDNIIVGLFKIRHYLNNRIRNYGGHIAYGILKEYRKKGYATKGLELAIEEARKIIKEDEIYLHCRLTNTASLKVQLKNGAKLHHKNEKGYFTRIKIR